MLWQKIQLFCQYEAILQAIHFVQYTHWNFNWFGWPWWAGKPRWTRQSRLTHARITLKKINIQAFIFKLEKNTTKPTTATQQAITGYIVTLWKITCLVGNSTALYPTFSPLIPDSPGNPGGPGGPLCPCFKETHGLIYEDERRQM